MRLPIPKYRAKSVFSLTPDFLCGVGIRLLLLDLDNTLIAYGGGAPDERLAEWVAELNGAGVEPFILSNNRRGHALKFARQLGVRCVQHAGKPSPKAVFEILRENGLDAGDCAIAGDQMYTDIFCAVRAGVMPILVDPIDISNFFRKIRYMLEFPFRCLCKNYVENCR